MAKEVALLTIHGMGLTSQNYANNLKTKIKAKLGENSN